MACAGIVVFALATILCWLLAVRRFRREEACRLQLLRSREAMAWRWDPTPTLVPKVLGKGR